MQHNSTSTLEALFNSLNDLGTAIHSARDKLVRRSSVPEEVLARLRSYDTILEKQRTLAFELCRHIQVENAPEVERTVNLINNLSKMIRDDAREVLSSVLPQAGATLVSSKESSDKSELIIC
jgi:hypothetical protein